MVSLVESFQAIAPNYYPKNAIGPNHLNLILGKSIPIALEKGSVLRWQDFQIGQGGFNPISAKIPKGYRALSVNLSQTGHNSRWLKPGDRIDVLGSFSLSEGDREITRTLFQNILVLNTKPQLILLVTPEQAELLLFSKSQGSLHASLRSREDPKLVQSLPEHEFLKFLGIRKKSRRKNTRVKSAPQFLHFQKPNGGK